MLCCRCKREIPDNSSFCCFCGKKQTSIPLPVRTAARRSKGSGCVRKKSGNRSKPYEAIYCHKMIGIYSTKGEAIVALDEFIAKEKPLDSASATFEQIYLAWKDIHFSDISEKTAQGYADSYDRAKVLHKKKMHALRTSDFQFIIDSLVTSGKSYSLCQKQSGLFMQLCTFALERDIVEKNYAEFIKLPKKPEPKQRVLSDQEQAAIWAVANTPGPRQDIARVAVVLFCTGMRIGELLSMRAADVHLNEGYAVGGEKTAAGKNRIIPLPFPIRSFIASWMRQGSEWMIPNEAGGKRDDSRLRKHFNELMKGLGIKGVTPHTCRHTCATVMAAAGVSPKAIQTILGHASYSTTATIYTHPQIAELVSASSNAFDSWTIDGQTSDSSNLKVL